MNDGRFSLLHKVLNFVVFYSIFLSSDLTDVAVSLIIQLEYSSV